MIRPLKLLEEQGLHSHFFKLFKWANLNCNACRLRFEGGFFACEWVNTFTRFASWLFNRHDFEEAAIEAQDSKWAHQTGHRATHITVLLRRAAQQ